MKRNDSQLGKPQTLFKGTTVELAALSAIEGMEAYDTTLGSLVVFDGAEWKEVGSIANIPPISTDFTWLNQGSATVEDQDDGLYLHAPADSNFNGHILYKNIPTEPYTVTVSMILNMIPINYSFAGISLLNSSSGLIVNFGVVNVEAQVITSDYLNSYSSFNNTYGRFYFYSFSTLWLRIEDNGTNRIQSISRDGVNFLQLYSVPRTTWMTPDKIGFYINPQNSSYPAGALYKSWEES